MVDVWVSTRASTSDPWSTPINLGPVVNSHAVTARPALYLDEYILCHRCMIVYPNFNLYASTRTKVKREAKTNQQ